MGIFSKTREIMKKSMDAEKETVALLKQNLLPVSGGSKLDILRGNLLKEFSETDQSEFAIESSYTFDQPPEICDL